MEAEFFGIFESERTHTLHKQMNKEDHLYDMWGYEAKGVRNAKCNRCGRRRLPAQASGTKAFTDKKNHTKIPRDTVLADRVEKTGSIRLVACPKCACRKIG